MGGHEAQAVGGEFRPEAFRGREGRALGERGEAFDDEAGAFALDDDLAAGGEGSRDGDGRVGGEPRAGEEGERAGEGAALQAHAGVDGGGGADGVVEGRRARAREVEGAAFGGGEGDADVEARVVLKG